jgi:hypothetical protein
VFPNKGSRLKKLFRTKKWKYSSRLWPPSCSRLSMPMQYGLTRLRLEGRVKSTAAESPVRSERGAPARLWITIFSSYRARPSGCILVAGVGIRQGGLQNGRPTLGN